MAWTYIGDQLTNTDFMSLPAEPFHGDSPLTMWRINENVNGGMPFLPLMIGLPRRQSAHDVAHQRECERRYAVSAADDRTACPRTGRRFQGRCRAAESDRASELRDYRDLRFRRDAAPESEDIRGLHL